MTNNHRLPISQLDNQNLLRGYADIMDELRARGVLRSFNNPVGDLAEYLFCHQYGWLRQPGSNKGFDALDGNGMRYEIKGRRVTEENPSRQLSALRNLNDRPFDFLAAVIFDREFAVMQAAIIPIDCVIKNSVYGEHTNSWKFHFTDDVSDADEVEKVIRLTWQKEF